MRTFEIAYTLKSSSNSTTQYAIIQASDTIMARRIFEQQNPGCKVMAAPREIK